MAMLALIAVVNGVTRLAALAAAVLLSIGLLRLYSRQVTALACGLLVAVATTHLIPEAFESGIDPHRGGLVLLASLLAFVAIDRIASGGEGHLHGTAGSHGAACGGIMSLVTGAACHNFVDGILVAASFLADTRAGFLVAGAIFLHEVPNLVGQLALACRLCGSRSMAVLACLCASMTAVAGGVAGGLAASLAGWVVPYALLVSASSFLYLFLCVMLPSVSGGSRRQAALFLAWTAAGCLLSFLVLSPLHEALH